jgi:hypothetical protein
VTGDKTYTDEEHLRKMYHGHGMTMAEIAERYGVTHNTVTYWMNQHGIERRGPDTHDHPDRYSEDEIISWIETFVEYYGVVPTTRDMKTWPGPSYPVVVRRFGSIAKAIKEAGYTSRSERQEGSG